MTIENDHANGHFMTTVTATRFKAECLGWMERVRRTGKPILITKHGRVVAQLAPPPAQPGVVPTWRQLRGSVRRMGDVVSPALRESDIDALR